MEDSGTGHAPAILKKPKSEHKVQSKRRAKKRAMSEQARGATLSIKCKIDTLSVSIDLPTFTQTFFNHKPLPEYSRLPHHHKLILAQYILHSQQKQTNALATPFVYRLSNYQQSRTLEQNNKAIQRKLATALNRSPLFWLTPEYDNNSNKKITHYNGEILLYPKEYNKKISPALRELHKYGKNDADGTKLEEIPANKVIVSRLPKRQKMTAEWGEFYPVFNWPGYSTKQDLDRELKQTLERAAQGRQRLRQKNAGLPLSPLQHDKTIKYNYIAADLNKQAAKFYNENIRKNTLTADNKK